MGKPKKNINSTLTNTKLLVTGGAGFLGLGLGVILAFVRGFAENSEKEEKDKMAEAMALVLKNISELIPGKSK